MKRYVLPILAALLLSSCIGIETQISFRNDGSGTVRLNYRISQFMKNLDVGKEEKTLPLPVSRDDFIRAAEGIDGLRLLSVNQRENEQDVFVEARMEFDRVEAVNQLSREGQIDASLAAQDGTRSFKLLIYRGQENAEISEDSLKMVEAFFEGYELTYTINTPAPIKRYSLGELSQDKRTLTYRVTVPELLKQKKKIFLELAW